MSVSQVIAAGRAALNRRSHSGGDYHHRSFGQVTPSRDFCMSSAVCREPDCRGRDCPGGLRRRGGGCGRCPAGAIGAYARGPAAPPGEDPAAPRPRCHSAGGLTSRILRDLLPVRPVRPASGDSGSGGAGIRKGRGIHGVTGIRGRGDPGTRGSVGRAGIVGHRNPGGGASARAHRASAGGPEGPLDPSTSRYRHCLEHLRVHTHQESHPLQALPASSRSPFLVPRSPSHPAPGAVYGAAGPAPSRAQTTAAADAAVDVGGTGRWPLP